MYKPKRNIKVDGKIYVTDKEYSDIPKGWSHEFVETEEKPKRKKANG